MPCTGRTTGRSESETRLAEPFLACGRGCRGSATGPLYCSLTRGRATIAAFRACARQANGSSITAGLDALDRRFGLEWPPLQFPSRTQRIVQPLRRRAQAVAWSEDTSDDGEIGNKLCFIDAKIRSDNRSRLLSHQ
jgi:hypothetical protein